MTGELRIVLRADVEKEDLGVWADYAKEAAAGLVRRLDGLGFERFTVELIEPLADGDRVLDAWTDDE